MPANHFVLGEVSPESVIEDDETKAEAGNFPAEYLWRLLLDVCCYIGNKFLDGVKRGLNPNFDKAKFG